MQSTTRIFEVVADFPKPVDVVAVIAFLAVALVVIQLMSQRKRAAEALQKALRELDSKVQQLARANDELRGEIGERQRAEEALQKAQAELAHVSA